MRKVSQLPQSSDAKSTVSFASTADDSNVRLDLGISEYKAYDISLLTKARDSPWQFPGVIPLAICLTLHLVGLKPTSWSWEA